MSIEGAVIICCIIGGVVTLVGFLLRMQAVLNQGLQESLGNLRQSVDRGDEAHKKLESEIGKLAECQTRMRIDLALIKQAVGAHEVEQSSA